MDEITYASLFSTQEARAIKYPPKMISFSNKSKAFDHARSISYNTTDFNPRKLCSTVVANDQIKCIPESIFSSSASVITNNDVLKTNDETIKKSDDVIRNDSKKITGPDIIAMNQDNKTDQSLLNKQISDSPLSQTTSSMFQSLCTSTDTMTPVMPIAFPDLGIDDINTSFKVVGELVVGTKLRIINNRYLAADDSSFSSFGRYYSGQGRESVIRFLDHLFNETVKHMNRLLDDVRDNKDVDNNINALTGMIYKLGIFLHHFENIRNVYRSDSNVYARLGNIRDNFFNFRITFFRRLILGNKN